MKSNNATRHGHLCCCLAATVFASQNRFTLKSPNGFVSSEFRGYQTCGAWPRTKPMLGSRSFSANPVMIKACQKGHPKQRRCVPGRFGRRQKLNGRKRATPNHCIRSGCSRYCQIGRIHQEELKMIPGQQSGPFAEFIHDTASAAFKPVGGNANLCEEPVPHSHPVKAKVPSSRATWRADGRTRNAGAVAMGRNSFS